MPSRSLLPFLADAASTIWDQPTESCVRDHLTALPLVDAPGSSKSLQVANHRWGLPHDHLRRRLGSGGMAEVYEGEAIDTGKRVAIKFLHNPSKEARILIAQTQMVLRGRVVVTTVVTARGFWSSVIIASLLSIKNLKPPGTNRERSFVDLDKACSWTTQFASGNLSSRDISSLVHQCREHPQLNPP